MDLNTLNTAALDERGALFTPRHPATLEPLDMAIWLRSKNCESVRAKARAFIKRIQTSADFRKTGIVDADLAEAQAINNLVACTVDWQGVAFNGEPLPCTADNARRIYADPGLAWLRAQVAEFTEEQANFLPKAGPASTATQSSSSASVVRSTTSVPSTAA